MRKAHRSKGLSHGSQVSFGSLLPGSKITKKRKINKTEAEIQESSRAEAARVNSYSADARRIILDNTSSIDVEMEGDGLQSGVFGEEGFYHSNAGGFEEPADDGTLHGWEDEELEPADDIHQLLGAPRLADQRTRRDRVQRLVDEWGRVMADMVDAYLEWSQNGAPIHTEGDEERWEFTVLSFTGTALKSACVALQTSVPDFSIRSLWNPRKSNHVAVSLARHGIIGCTPEAPTLGFDISLFRIFRQLHRPPRSGLAAQLRAAYDTYLAIQGVVKQQMQTELGRTSPSVQRVISCPPCFYKLEGEPALSPAFLAAMDGNNSLKGIDTAVLPGVPRLDTRTLTSDHWLEPEEVDVFADEVRRSKGNNTNRVENETDGSVDATGVEEIAWLNEMEVKGLETCVNTCVDRWKAAAPDSKKKIASIFAITGIFVICCRHGHLLVICDMIKSGELMKYPLSVLDRLMRDYGEDARVGYDIWCAFVTTLRQSRLGAKAVAMNLTGVVPAFHGHAHNRHCQCLWHPTYKPGSGLEDHETCERTFNLSNNLAPVTRLATHFHRRQEIDEHFQFQHIDKHANSGRFLFENYSQALECIKIEGDHLSTLCSQLSITPSDLEDLHENEKAYLDKRTGTIETDSGEAEYMELLLKASKLREAADEADKRYKEMNGARGGYTAKEIKTIETKWATTFRRWKVADDAVTNHEDMWGFSPRWQPGTPQYEAGKQALAAAKYRKAVENLERLLVQRMMEMTKLNMSGTGYKQRDKISKALRTRASAIRTALQKYNSIASEVTPPRPSLTLSEVLGLVSVGDLDYLRDNENLEDVYRWANPTYRELVTLHFHVQRAHEEVHRLNVEIRRLATFIRDEDLSFRDAIIHCKSPGLSHELRLEYQYRRAIHTEIQAQLVRASQLKGFSGTLEPGLVMDPVLRLTSDATVHTAAGPPHLVLAGEFEESTDDDGGDGERMEAWFENLS